MRNEDETVYGNLAQHIGNILAERWHTINNQNNAQSAAPTNALSNALTQITMASTGNQPANPRAKTTASPSQRQSKGRNTSSRKARGAT